MEEFLSSPTEVHALLHGFFVAFFVSPIAGKEYEAELHYWRLGFIIGWTVRVLMVALIGHAVMVTYF